MRDDNNANGSAIAWLAIIIAVVALILSWIAFNRTGKDLEDSAADTIQQTTEQLDDGAQDAGETIQEGTDAIEQGLDTGPDGVDDGAQ